MLLWPQPFQWVSLPKTMTSQTNKVYEIPAFNETNINPDF